MKKLLLIIILSFLVMVNIRMWGIRDGSCLLNGTQSRKLVCDIGHHNNELANDGDMERIKNWNENRALARKLAYVKHRKQPNLYQNQPRATPMATVPSYDAVQRMLYNTIVDFAYHPSCNELTLQQLIDLMQIEMQLLTVFIYPTAGSRFSLLHRRAVLLTDATPSVRMLFDKILSMAMYNNQLNEQYEKQLKDSQQFNIALNNNDKKIFLHTAYQRIADVQKKIKRMQYLIATQYV